ncbi:MAG TPA: AI-2E family transporter [Polyangia bacterium]|nr:AI-2E family transporter [Polyangia bacterium]
MTPATRTLAWLRQFAKLWGFALFCVLIVYLFREVALPFIFAILVAYILAPVVDRFGRLRVGGKPFPRAAAVIILYVNIIAVLSVFIGYFVPKLSGDFARLFREAPQLFAKVNREWLPRAGAWVDQHFGPEAAPDGATGEDAITPSGPAVPSPPAVPNAILLEPAPDGRYQLDLQSLSFEIRPTGDGRYMIGPASPQFATATGGKWERSIKQWLAERLKSTEGESQRAIEYGQKFIGAVVSGIGRLFLVLMVAAFILVDLDRIQGFLRSLVPEQYQLDYDRIATGVDRGLSGVIRGQIVICAINGTLTYLGLWLFHVKYPLLLAGIAATMSLVPIFGSILSSVPIVAIALISSGTFDLRQGLFVLAWIIGIHLVEANLLNPKIMGDAAKIHPVLVVFALIAGEHSYGLVGALFAVPVASIIQTIFSYYRRRPRPAVTAVAPPM